MIFDKITNWEKYFPAEIANKLRPAFEQAAKFIAGPEEKRYDIDGDNIYCMVSSYTTKLPEDALIEYHRKYVDIQILQSGEEIIGWSLPESTPEESPYCSDKDCAFHDYDPDKSLSIKMQPGFFVVFFTDEGHAPCITSKLPATVAKVVIKIKKELFFNES